MGEAKMVGEDVVFNITPSPGASTCLKNAMRDTRTVIEFLDGEYEFDEAGLGGDDRELPPTGDGGRRGRLRLLRYEHHVLEVVERAGLHEPVDVVGDDLGESVPVFRRVAAGVGRDQHVLEAP